MLMVGISQYISDTMWRQRDTGVVSVQMALYNTMLPRNKQYGTKLPQAE